MAPRLKRLLPATLAALALLAWATAALARPGGGQHFGGGHSYSGSGSHSSYSGGGGGGIGDLLFWLILDVPWIGIPGLLIGLFVLYRIYGSRLRAGGGGDEDEAVGAFGGGAARIPPRQALQALRADDPAFSLPLFEDFLTQLYAQTQELRGTHRLDQLSPYLSPEVRAALTTVSASLSEVQDVIVGGLTITAVAGLDEQAASSPSDRVQVQVRFETNLTEVANGAAAELWSVEAWTLERKRTAKSRPKGAIELLRCPNCGAPFDGSHGATCSYCRQTIDTGDFDWLVTNIDVLERTHKLAPEAGGRPAFSPPTIVDPDADAGLAALKAADPAFDWQAFAERVGLIFGELQVAWSTLNWPKARPYITDGLSNAETYWIERFKHTHRRNVTEGAKLERIELVSCVSDVAYDAITIRMWADGLDYTIDEATGQVVEGSKTARQGYSEYWTFLRGRGVTGRPSAERTCPSCGAPIQVNQAGDCAHCRAHLTSGDFDWVLSRIEQDSAYG